MDLVKIQIVPFFNNFRIEKFKEKKAADKVSINFETFYVTISLVIHSNFIDVL